MCFNECFCCLDVDTVLAVVAAGDVADADDLCASFLEEECVVGPDVAEALYDDCCCFGIYILGLEEFKNAGRNAESRCCCAAF